MLLVNANTTGKVVAKCTLHGGKVEVGQGLCHPTCRHTGRHHHHRIRCLRSNRRWHLHSEVIRVNWVSRDSKDP